MTMTKRRRGRALLWAVALAATTVAAYLALLGWDTRKTLDVATGNETGPYAVWQIALLALVVGALAFMAGRKRQIVPAVTAVPLALSGVFAVLAITSPEPGIWPVGAVLLALGSAAATAVVAMIGRSTASHRTA